MSMEEVLKELQKEYISELPEKIKAIHQAYEAQDFAKVTECFHKIKGSGKTYAVEELSEIGRVLEEVCLKYRGHLGWAVPKAIYFMQQVYTYRLADKTYNPAGNEDFQKLLDLIGENRQQAA